MLRNLTLNILISGIELQFVCGGIIGRNEIHSVFSQRIKKKHCIQYIKVYSEAINQHPLHILIIFLYMPKCPFESNYIGHIIFGFKYLKSSMKGTIINHAEVIEDF